MGSETQHYDYTSAIAGLLPGPAGSERMDEHEYLEKFRLAILWDEFRRREFPKGITITRGIWRLSYRRRLENSYRKQSQPIPFFDWDPIVLYGADIEMYLRWIWKNDYDDQVVFSLRHTIWYLKHALVEVRNANILDYYEHLLYVAHEVLKEIDKARSRSDK